MDGRDGQKEELRRHKLSSSSHHTTTYQLSTVSIPNLSSFISSYRVACIAKPFPEPVPIFLFLIHMFYIKLNPLHYGYMPVPSFSSNNKPRIRNKDNGGPTKYSKEYAKQHHD
jgi:hypothetical protein